MSAELFTVIYVQGVVVINHEGIVGKLAGWLTYFPALPNCVSIFQNSTGGSGTTSFTLQDC